MTTGASLVEDALLEAAILGVGETVSAEDQTLALRIINRMLDSWGNENLMIYATTTESFVMTPSLASYSTTLLAAGRPVSISSMYVSLNTIDYPVNMVTQQEYQAIPYKPTPAIPNQCFYDPGMPNGTFYFYPTPYAAFTCYVSSNRVLAGTITAATVLTLPPGYEKAIIDNAAKELCRPFTKPLPPDLVKSASDAKSWLKRTNYVPTVMDSVMDKGDDISNAFLYKGF